MIPKRIERFGQSTTAKGQNGVSICPASKLMLAMQ